MKSDSPTKFRRTRRVLVWALILVVGFFALLHLLLPPLVERLIVRALHQHGWEHATVQVRFVSLSRADLAGIDLGEGALQIDSIRINYSLRSLLDKRVEDVLLAGVQVHYPEVMSLIPPGGSVAPSAGSGKSTIPLPFRSVSFSDARLFMVQGKRTEAVVVRGEVRAETGSTLQAQMHAGSDYGTVSASGRVDVVQGVWQLTLSDPAVRWHALLARFDQRLPAGLQLAPLEADIQLENSGSDESTKLHLSLRQPLSWYGHTNAVRIVAEGVQVPDLFELSGDAVVEQKSFSYRTLKATADQVALPFSANIRPGISTNISAHLAVEELLLVDAEKQLQVGPIAAHVPLPTQPGQMATGRVDITEMQIAEHALGGLRAHSRISFSEASAIVLTDLLTDTKIGMRIAPGEHGPVASVAIPLFEMASKAPLLALAKAGAGVDLRGSVGITGVLDPRSDPPMLFSTTLLDVGLEQKGFSLEGLSGTVQFDDLARLQSRPHQQVSVRKLSAGKFQMTEGSMVFTVEHADQIFVEENHWNWAGGRLFSAAFLFRPGSHRLRMEAYCEGVELQQVLNLAIGDHVSGKGALYGRIPLSVGWDPYRFSIGEGYLFAAPGKGQIQVKDQGMIDQVLAGATQSLGNTTQGKRTKEGILLSLKDFEYEAMRLDFRKTDSGFPAGSMHLIGEGRDPALGLPLNLTINFSGE